MCSEEEQQGARVALGTLTPGTIAEAESALLQQSGRVPALPPEQLRELAAILAELLRHEMQLEQERYRRPRWR